jgi:hypothetical protein
MFWNQSDFHKSTDTIISCHLHILRRMSCMGHVARMGEMRNAYIIIIEKLDGNNRPLGRSSA